MRMDPKRRMKRFPRISTRKIADSEIESGDKVVALHHVSSMQPSFFKADHVQQSYRHFGGNMRKKVSAEHARTDRIAPRSFAG